MKDQGRRGLVVIRKLAHELAGLLDKVSVHSEACFDTGARLKSLLDDWTSGGGDLEGQSLIREAQAVAGMINATRDNDPMRDHAYRQLTNLKNRLREKARPS